MAVYDWSVPSQWSSLIGHYALALLGHRWAFLDGWDAECKRIWRSQPLPLVA